MANIMFDQFKALLVQLTNDSDVLRKNYILQDASYRADIQARIESLTPDVVLQQTYTDVISTLGLLEVDTRGRKLKFVPKGFATTLSAFREGMLAAPRHLFLRPTVTDDVYYLLADWSSMVAGNGAFMLNDKLEVIRRIPNYGTDMVGTQYSGASSAITFTIGTVEYVAIACALGHCVKIYLYNAPYTWLATIGTPTVSGADATHLDTPNALAIDTASGKLYISCPTGQPAGATADNGFIAVWNVSAPAAPTFDSIPWSYRGTGSLLDTQVFTPSSVFYDGRLLWVSNSQLNHVGGFSGVGATPVCTRFIEYRGAGYQLQSPQQIFVRTLLGGYQRLYIANSAYGTIEEFDATTSEHLTTYGIRASEDDLNSLPQMSTSVYGALGSPVGVAASNVVIDDTTTDVLVVTDNLNVRLHRFNLDAYTEDNFANFEPLTFGVPVVLNGWTVGGTVPPDMIKVFYRFAQTDDFQELAQDAVLPPTSSVQFRVGVTLDTRRFLKDWYITKLKISGMQA